MLEKLYGFPVPKSMLIFLKEKLNLFSCHLNSLHLREMRRMGHNKTVILVTGGLLLFAAVFFYTLRGEAEKYRSKISSAVKVEKTWKLPALLKEVSGIAFLPPNKIACVQDERGSIFIYNLETSKIEKEVKFAGKGDFEGITIYNNVAYALQSNGMIYRITDFLKSPKIDKFETAFTSKNDMEGIFYDKSLSRLLLAAKAEGLKEGEKSIYAISLPSMQVETTPAYTLTFEEEIFEDIRKENREDSFFPSDVGVHPSTGDIYILEAREPKLLILEKSGVPKALHLLSRQLFPQPEGITFDDSGNLYISNEGNPATIHLVKITPQ